MCSDTDNLTFIQNNNLFCLHDGGNTLCNNKDGRVFGISFQRFSQFRIGLKVQCGEGIVKDIDWCFLNQRSCDGKSLALTARYVGTTLADLSIKSVFQRTDKLCCLCNLCAFLQCLVGSFCITVSQVCCNGAAEEQTLLWYITNFFSQLMLTQIADIHTINGDAALCYIIKTRNQVNKGGFT